MMGRKSLGTALELGMVKKAFKAGGWGFRAPGSGGFTPNADVVQRTKLQEECTIPISVRNVDFSFKIDYLNADYTAFFPEWKEVRVVEAKTVRPKRDKDGNRKNAKETEVIAYYYLIDEHKISEIQDSMRYLYEMLYLKGYPEYAEKFAIRYAIPRMENS